MTNFFLARHGETEWNRVRRLQGQKDSVLTSQGVEQADKLAQVMADKNISSIYSSPLGRALNTAKKCQQALAIKTEIVDGLQERFFGLWQEQYFDDLKDEPHFEQVFFQVSDKAPPQGESGIDCGKRIEQSLRKIAADKGEQNILIVTHGDAIRCFLAQLSDEAACNAYSQYGNGRVFPVSFCHQSKNFSLV